MKAIRFPKNVILLGFALWPAFAFAQTPPVESARKRPRIGLVLEGGGALGFAHIGVLQWLEEHRIPVDYIAGTSMGGLIGGLYASGQRPSEIHDLARNINWAKTISGEVVLQDLTFRRKEDRIDYPNRLFFGLKGGLSLPGGLNTGHEIGLILDRAALPYYDLASFDELPIPFRCVGTEIVSGTQTIFDRGSLSRALRSTMSIPAVFAPVKDNGKIFTDGGALNNLPVDVAKNMGADIIIAVYLNPGTDDPKMYQSLLGAAARNIAIMIAANEIRSMQQADILLSAELKGFSSTDFTRSEAIIPKGVEAAARKAALLERFALSEDEWKQHLAARDARKRTRVPEPAFVSVNGANPERSASIEAALSSHTGNPLDPAALENELRQLNGAGYYESIGYSIATRNGREGLAIRATEKNYAPPFLNAGLNIDGTDTSDIRFGLTARATFMDLGGYRSELRLEGFFGAANGVRSEYFHPFTNSSNWFIAPRVYATNRNFEIYSNRQRLAQYVVGNNGLGVDIGYSISRRAEIRFGQAVDWQSGKLRIGQPLVPNATFGRGISSLRFRYVGQDDAIIPHKGFTLGTELKAVSSSPNGAGRYSAAATRIAYFQPVTRSGSMWFTGAGGTSFGARGLGAEAFALGGPLNLSAFGRNELLGNQYYLMQGGYLHELFKINPLLGDALYAVAFYELGKVYGPLLPNTPRNPMDATALIVVKTLFGPVFAGGSLGDGFRAKWWFGMGRVF